MIELLKVGDQHLDSVAPSSRKDDYFESMKAKLEEIREIAIQRKVFGVLFTGDLIHKQDGHRVPYLVVNWLIDYFKSYPADIHKFLAMGNHDIKSVAAKWHRQPIGAIVKAGVVDPLWTDPTVSNPLGAMTYDFPNGLCVHGKLFDYEADAPDHRAAHYSVNRFGYRNTFWIMVAHTALIPDNQTFFGHFTTPSDLAPIVPEDKAADLYVCGHIHDWMGEYGAYHIRAMNVGALARGTIDEFNLKRDVVIGSIKLDRVGNSWHCDISQIKLASAKPADEIFYKREIEQKKQRAEDLERLAEMLRAGNIADEFSLVNPDQALEAVLKAKTVSPQAEKKVRQYVLEAKQELG